MADDVLIIGGGPAGMMSGLLFARAGVRVRVLEKHDDFLRDFRGDTVHPSTMEILEQLGLLDDFLARPHHRLDRVQIRLAGREWRLGDLSHLDTPAPFVAMMPQWDFLDFLRDHASAYSGFALEMNHPVTGFVEEDGRVVGVRTADGRARRATSLVIAADGRDSLVRTTKLPVQSLGAPIDVLWFRLGKVDQGDVALRGSIEAGRIVVMIDRGDYWQCALVIPKGAAGVVTARGAAAVRGDVERAFPDMFFGSGLEKPCDLRLLTVALDRLTRWHCPGLLAIGDAAHAMSPIGGIGINLAIQDAVASANILAGPIVAGRDVNDLLNKVQKRRELPTRLVQAAQKAAQDRVIRRVLASDRPLARVPLALRLLDRFPLLRRIPGRMIGLGIRRERVQSPLAPSPAGRGQG